MLDNIASVLKGGGPTRLASGGMLPRHFSPPPQIGRVATPPSSQASVTTSSSTPQFLLSPKKHAPQHASPRPVAGGQQQPVAKSIPRHAPRHASPRHASPRPLAAPYRHPAQPSAPSAARTLLQQPAAHLPSDLGCQKVSASPLGSHRALPCAPPPTQKASAGQAPSTDTLAGSRRAASLAGTVVPTELTQPLILAPQPALVSVCADTLLQLKEFFAKRNAVESNVLRPADLQLVLADCGFRVTLEALQYFFSAFGSDSQGDISFQELMAVFHSPPTPTLTAPPALGRARDGKMVDTQFPPARNSVFGSPNTQADTLQDLLAATGGGQIQWVRAGELISGRGLFHSVHPNDLADGATGDGWLLGGLASLAESEGSIFHLLEQKSSSRDGQYCVRIFDARKQQWEAVNVDDYIPVHAGTHNPIVARPQGNEMWVLIVEKALAKWFGSYAQCQRMHCLFPLMLLTDTGPCKVFAQRHAAQVYSEDSYMIEQVSVSDARSRDGVQSASLGQCAADRVWLELRMAENRSFLGVVWTEKGPPEQKMADGIMRNRLYTILEAVQITAHDQVWCTIRLRNPWASDPSAEWQGALSESWSRWPELPDLHEELAIGSASLEGSFWISWEDFRMRFSHIGIVPKEMEVPRLGRVEPWAPTPADGARHHKRFKRPVKPPARTPAMASLVQSSGSANDGASEFGASERPGAGDGLSSGAPPPTAIVGFAQLEMAKPEEILRRSFGPPSARSFASPRKSARSFASPRDPRFNSMARGLSAAAQCAVTLGVSQEDFMQFASETFSQLQAQSASNSRNVP